MVEEVWEVGGANVAMHMRNEKIDRADTRRRTRKDGDDLCEKWIGCQAFTRRGFPDKSIDTI